MTISEMHYRVGQWLDTAKSPRFPKEQVDNALNSGIDSIVNEKYYPYDPKEREKSFQTMQRIRDELYPLIELPVAIPVSGSEVLPLSGLTNYRYLLSLIAIIDGVEYPTIPTTYDELEDDLINDPYKRPRLDYPSRVYRIEAKDGIHIKWGDVGVLTGGKLTYLRDPAVVNLDFHTNCDLPKNLHEDVCRMAAEILKNQALNLSSQRQQ